MASKLCGLPRPGNPKNRVAGTLVKLAGRSITSRRQKLTRQPRDTICSRTADPPVPTARRKTLAASDLSGLPTQVPRRRIGLSLLRSPVGSNPVETHVRQWTVGLSGLDEQGAGRRGGAGGVQRLFIATREAGPDPGVEALHSEEEAVRVCSEAVESRFTARSPSIVDLGRTEYLQGGEYEVWLAVELRDGARLTRNEVLCQLQFTAETGWIVEDVSLDPN